jgi:hypothetical protein
MSDSGESPISWNLYEVVFFNSLSPEPSHDTIYLVSARTFEEAVEEVCLNASKANHSEGHFWIWHPKEMSPQIISKPVRGLLPHWVFEIGIFKPYGHEERPRILRGPYFQPAYNYGHRRWAREFTGTDYGDKWVEDFGGLSYLLPLSLLLLQRSLIWL